MIKKIILQTLIFAIFLLGFNVNASTVYLNSTSNKLSTSEVFRVDFLINTENSNINAFESSLSFDSNFLELQKIYKGNSTVAFWVKSPRIQGNKIFFSGITPGGFNGENGKIFSALFVAKQPGITSIEIDSNSKFLLNDGNATEDKFKIKNLLLEIVNTNNNSSNNNQPVTNKDNTANPPTNTDNQPVNNQTPVVDKPIDNSINNTDKVNPEDTTRPEEFTVKIIKDSKIGNGKFSIIFNAQDKDSGIDYYEVKEGDEAFKRAESPYVLQFQDLTKEIQVKAVDLAGNYRIEKIGPFIINEKKAVINYNVIIISLLFIVFVLILLNAYLNRRNKLKNEKNNNI